MRQFLTNRGPDLQIVATTSAENYVLQEHTAEGSQRDSLVHRYLRGPNSQNVAGTLSRLFLMAEFSPGDILHPPRGCGKRQTGAMRTRVCVKSAMRR